MNAENRRKLEMGSRALEYSKAHPDASAGYTAALGQLEERVGRAETLARQQRAGYIAVRTATTRKRELRSLLHHAFLAHLARVAQVAAKEEPEIAGLFRFPAENTSYHAFRTAARAMADEATARRELLVRHGLAEPLLGNLTQVLDDFDRAVDDSVSGRRSHVGARAELAAVVREIQQVVHVLDGFNRFRFAGDAEKLAEWESASNVLGPMRAGGPRPEAGGETPPTGDQAQPAA